MANPPFTMSKYANETELLRDKCAWLEEQITDLYVKAGGDLENGLEIGTMVRHVAQALNKGTPAITESKEPQ